MAAAPVMNRKEATQFQRDIRKGLTKTERERLNARLAEIAGRAKTQRSACRQEVTQVVERLDQAVRAEQSAVEAAKLDQKRAHEAERAAKERVKVAKALRSAQRTQKARECKIEAEEVRETVAAELEAERAHQRELRTLQRQATAREKPVRAPGGRRQARAEKASEERDEVEGNLLAASPELVPLWRRVGPSFKVPKRAEGRVSLTEAFQEWAAENPEEAFGAQEEGADFAAEQAAHEAAQRAGEEPAPFTVAGLQLAEPWAVDVAELEQLEEAGGPVSLRPSSLRPSSLRPSIASARRRDPEGARMKRALRNGGLNNPGNFTEILVHGALVVGGTLLAVQLDTRIEARPFGLRPSVYAFGGSVAVAVVAGRAKKRKLCTGAAAVAIGLAAGFVAQGLAAG